MSRFSFYNEVCRLNQANCEIQHLISLIVHNKGVPLNGEIKRLGDVSTKISDIRDKIEKISKALEK